MQEEIAIMIGVVAIITIVGVLLVTLPITRRLGVALEQWIRIRAEGAVGQTQLDQMGEQLRALGRHVEALEDRVELLSERQDFTESLVEATPERKPLSRG